MRRNQHAVVADDPESCEFGQVRVIGQTTECGARVSGEAFFVYKLRQLVADNSQIFVAFGNLVKALETEKVLIGSLFISTVKTTAYS